MGRAARTNKGGNSSGSPDGSRTSSDEPQVHTLSVSVSGPGRAELKVDGASVSTDCSGSHQIPHGARVQLTGHGRDKKKDGWQGWEGGAPVRGNTLLFYMQSDIEVSGTAVAKDQLDRPDKINKATDAKWVDPLGGGRAAQEELSAGMAAELLREQGIENPEAIAEALREAGFRPEGLPEDVRNALSPEALEMLHSLRPAISSKIPDHIQDPAEALRWLRADRSLILDPETSVPGMTEAGQFLSDAIDRGDRIAVFVDYDVDGITSGEILREAFGVHGSEVQMGYADLENGFGLNEDFVRQAHADGCQVIVTADCGSASEDAVALAQSLGMQVVVTDHHETDGHEDNPADFHLNPDLHGTEAAGNTGSQVAWKLATALHEARGGVPDSHYDQSLWMAGFGCRADGGDMLGGENRAFMSGGQVPEGVQELADRLHALGHEDNPRGDMSDLDSTREAMNLGKRLDHIENVEKEPATSRSKKDPLPRHIHRYDHEAREYRDMGPAERPKPGGKVTSREDFSPEDVARAVGHPDPKVRAEAQEKVIRAYEYHNRLKKEAEQAIRESVSGAWKADDGRIVRDPGLPTVAHIVLEDERMEGMSRPAANALQTHTRSPSVAFVPAGQDEDGNDLVKFSATPVRGQTAPLGEAMSEIEDVCSELGGHEQVFGGVCRRQDIPEVMSRLNTWADRQPDLVPESVSGPREPVVWVSERGIDSGEALSAVERGRDMLAPYTENFHSYDHFGPSVAVVGTVSGFRSPPDGTDANGKKVQAASSSPTHFAVLRLRDGTEREIKIGSRGNMEALRAAQESAEEVELALALNPRTGDAHAVRAFKPLEKIPF